MKRTILAMALIASFALTSAPAAWAQAQKPETEEKAEKVKDPVCNMTVDKNPKLSAKYKGNTYYFCMKKDVEAFKKDPEKYLKGKAHPHPA